jgi:ribosome recycling factor
MTPAPAGSLSDHIKHAKQLMDKAVEAVKREFSTVRTGKATTALLDLVRVEAYGNEMPLTQVASVAAPEPKLLTVQPWDKGLLKAVEKGILASDLGLTPSNDGNIIRIPIPPLTEERRKELVKVIHKFAEEGRVAIRHARTETMNRIKKHLKAVDAAIKTKEAEVMEV